jgi:hypothetical protein
MAMLPLLALPLEHLLSLVDAITEARKLLNNSGKEMFSTNHLQQQSGYKLS